MIVKLSSFASRLVSKKERQTSTSPTQLRPNHPQSLRFLFTNSERSISSCDSSNPLVGDLKNETAVSSNALDERVLGKVRISRRGSELLAFAAVCNRLTLHRMAIRKERKERKLVRIDFKTRRAGRDETNPSASLHFFVSKLDTLVTVLAVDPWHPRASRTYRALVIGEDFLGGFGAFEEGNDIHSLLDGSRCSLLRLGSGRPMVLYEPSESSGEVRGRREKGRR